MRVLAVADDARHRPVPQIAALRAVTFSFFMLVLADSRSCRPYEKFARCASNARAGAAQILTRSVLACGSAPRAASGLSLAFLASSPGKTLFTAKVLKIDSTTTREEC